MAIVNMASNSAETFPDGAYCDLRWSRESAAGRDQAQFVIVLYRTHAGLCLRDHEMNGHDDSDFYMLVWNPATEAPEEICYASTRGWTYPCLASAVDATDETRAAYAAYLARQEQAAREARAKREAATPVKGRRVRVIGGRKLAKGTTGVVFWYGETREFGACPRGGYKEHSRELRRYADSLGISDPRDGKRVGIVLGDGSKVFLNATHVEVIGEESAA